MKICPKCKTEKSLDQFWKTCSYCKECQKEHWRNRISKNKEAYAERRKTLWKRKNSRECKKCGEFFIGKGRERVFCSTKCLILGNTAKRKTGCWEWKGDVHPNGYAYATNYEQQKKYHAHRVSYEIFKGPIPDGLYVCHHCDNRKCVNPEHLFVGTAKENMQDAKQKGRLEHIKEFAAKGTKNGNAKLNEEAIKEIRILLAEGKKRSYIARKFNVSWTVIDVIFKGKGWKHVE